VPVLVSEHGAGLTKRREHLGLHLQPHDAIADLRLRRVARPIAGLVLGDELLDLPQIHFTRGLDPLAFGRIGRDTRQLAHGSM
jgi:hypothetical protein